MSYFLIPLLLIVDKYGIVRVEKRSVDPDILVSGQVKVAHFVSNKALLFDFQRLCTYTVCIDYEHRYMHILLSIHSLFFFLSIFTSFHNRSTTRT